MIALMLKFVDFFVFFPMKITTEYLIYRIFSVRAAISNS